MGNATTAPSTRIEISFGPALPCDHDVLSWASMACRMAQGPVYSGRSSPYWYDTPQFQELLFASGDTRVWELIASLDGCTGAKAGEIVAAAHLTRAICKNVTSQEAAKLLQAARTAARPVKAERLGAVEPANPFAAYARATDTAPFGSVRPFAEIPFVVEAWAQRAPSTRLRVHINCTPIAGEVQAARDKPDIDAFGCGLAHKIAQAPVGSHFRIVMNLITPYMPITSDGKEPDLAPFLEHIQTVVERAVRKAHRPTGTSRTCQKDIMLDNLNAAIADLSGHGQFRFNQRQILYVLRKVIMDEIGETLTAANFSNIITEYENEQGETPLMYREPRGTLYHRNETITLGTLMVDHYNRPIWTFNKLLYVEKEGFSEALKDSGWPERHDCTPMSSKGFSTLAARDLVDLLAEHDEGCKVFCAHDADSYGPMIYRTFQEETKARGARKVQIINLGLEPWEVTNLDLEIEAREPGARRKPIANYIIEREDGAYWENWLQTNRIELNAMITRQFIAWLDTKMARYEKLIPPDAVLEADLDASIENKVSDVVVERILREANADGQIAAAIAKIDKPDATNLVGGIKHLYKHKPDAQWRDHIETVALECADRAGARRTP